MKNIYIAGPDVFKKDAVEIGINYVNLCKKYGFNGYYPLDNKVDFSQKKKKVAQDIFVANKELIDNADIVIANLDSFRGKEPDGGTVWEVGYASALGKSVYGYMDNTDDYVKRFEHYEKTSSDGKYFDKKNMSIEDFEHPVNLMIACSVEKIISGSFEDVLMDIQKQYLHC